MKAKIFFLIAGLAFSLFSCNNDPSGVEVKTDGEFILTSDDIISFNITTGEIIFSNLIYDKLSTGDWDNFSSLVFNFNDKPLFESVKLNPPYSSIAWVGFVVLEIHFNEYNEFLNKIYYDFYLIDRRDSNSKNKEQWDTFINYLINAGKIISSEQDSYKTPSYNEGDVLIYSKNYQQEGDELYRVFEVENLKEGEYYVEGWLMPCFDTAKPEEGFFEHKIIVNDLRPEFTFKPIIGNWDWVELTEENGLPATVKLQEGANKIKVIGVNNWIYPPVDIIKLSLKSGG